MKKILILLAVGFIVSTSCIAQYVPAVRVCNYKPETKQLVKALDSLANFVKNIQHNVSSSEWTIFLSEISTDKGLASFDVLGQSGVQMKNTYAGIDMDATTKMSTLLNVIDPGQEKPISELKRIIQEEVKCYLSDTVENSITYALTDNGRLAPLNLGAGPCERDARSCYDNVENVYLQNMMNCGFGGAGIGAFTTGWWGLGAAGVCALGSIVRRNNARNTCFDNYFDCLGIPNPLH